MTDSSILYEVEDKLARIWLNAPEQRNALTYTMVQELIAALREADASQTVRVVLLAAKGDNFSAGGNLREFAAEVDLPAIKHWESGASWEALFGLMPQMKKPVIGAVQGFALAGGCGLTALCDMAVAADDARLGMTEIRIGLFPLIVLPALIRAVGQKKAMELAFTGTIIDAEEALSIGLVNQVVPTAELEERALALAGDLAEKSPEAVQLGKRLFWDTAGMTYGQALSYGRSLRVNYMLSEDLREGIDAFLNKRKPNW